MPRLVYESEADRLNEKSALDELVRHWGGSWEPLKPFYPADAVLLAADETIRSFVEVKCRTRRMGEFDTYIVSLHKVKALSEMASFTQRAAILLVRWTDATGWWRIPVDSIANYRIRMGGTKRRNDKQDIEPLVEIPISEFEIVGSL